MPGENFPLKKVNSWPMGQKDGNFLFWSMPELMVALVTFRVEKAHISLRYVFFYTHCRTNKIRDLFKVKLYAIRSETKNEGERERKRKERERKREREKKRER